MGKQKQLFINLTASILAFIVNLGIGFFLTPYIIRNIGVEAYGFVSLGSNFINYASLVTIALNSMAGRFITIEIHKNNWDEANKYFNSVLIANAIVAILMVGPSILFTVYIDKIINVPAEILTDVRILFMLLFINYLISIVVSSFGVSTFATNKLHLKSLREIEARIIKAVLLVVLFGFLKPAVSYMGLIAVIITLYITVFNVYYTKKYLPLIKFRKAYFNTKAVIELISSGIWNTIIKVGQILLEGVDLLIANLFISATAMGSLALAKTIPTLIVSLIIVIAGVFVPDFTILYAQNKPLELVNSIKRSMKMLGLIINIPVAILVVFGNPFFSLWIPNENPEQLQILAIITVATLVISGPINSIYSVFTVTNKLRTNAIILLFTGLLNVLIVFFLLNVTNLGVYAIAGVSTVMGIIRNIVFTVPYGAKYLGLKATTFYPEVFKSVLGFTIMIVVGSILNSFFEVDNWIKLGFLSGMTGIIGILINSMIILNGDERRYLFRLVKKLF